MDPKVRYSWIVGSPILGFLTADFLLGFSVQAALLVAVGCAAVAYCVTSR